MMVTSLMVIGYSVSQDEKKEKGRMKKTPRRNSGRV